MFATVQTIVGLKGKEREQILWCCCASSSKSVPVVIPASKGNCSWTMTVFLQQKLGTRWSPEYKNEVSYCFPWMETAWRERGKSGTVCQGKQGWEERTADSRGWADLAPLLHCVGLFPAQSILWVLQHISAALGWKMKQLQGGCSFFLEQASQPVGNESYSWTLKQAESTQMQKCRVKPFNRVRFGTEPWKKPAVMTNPFLMCVVVGKITSLKDHFSPCIGCSSLLSV